MEKYKELLALVNQDKLPEHIGIIMDGNGRWARRHNTTRLNGHKHGANAVREVVESSVEIGLHYLTIYAFSTENWRRPKTEVHGLLKLIMDTLLKEIDELAKNNIVVRFIGSKKGLDEKYYHKITRTCKKSWDNTGLNLNVAMNYGGRQELVEMAQKMLKDHQKGLLKEEEIDDKLLRKYLYTGDMPDPDLLIRTSGELRLSNFLIWQSAYAELWFTETLWPDFNRVEFIKAILDYQKRKRRFGASE
ncbi:MAG: isoprenyl transferase [Candidatus Cloacimonetes bacterium]|nr:isoprenyl transferase [Candidatus Cloacimonadota bacterium]